MLAANTPLPLKGVRSLCRYVREALGRPATRAFGGVFALYVALALALTWPMAKTFTTEIGGGFGDGFQNLWNFWWMKEALSHRQAMHRRLRDPPAQTP
jgi:hypothetical protein